MIIVASSSVHAARMLAERMGMKVVDTIAADSPDRVRGISPVNIVVDTDRINIEDSTWQQQLTIMRARGSRIFLVKEA